MPVQKMGSKNPPKKFDFGVFMVGILIGLIVTMILVTGVIKYKEHQLSSSGFSAASTSWQGGPR